MRSRISRHLGLVLPEVQAAIPKAFTAASLKSTGVPRTETVPVLPPEFNWRDYTVMLFHVASEIEHSLMVQYLFAAYSLGGPQVPEHLRADVRRWQEIILGIAKEEMGHLVSVQNLLTVLGAPLNFDREDYPWGSEFYPFAFTLQRLTLDSLAKYVCAESPAHWSGPEAEEIKRRAAFDAGQEVNRVGALYARLDQILANREWLPDTVFQSWTLPYQASWDEWGRGYTQGERGRESGNVPSVQAPELLIEPVTSRDSARQALHAIGQQGEAFTESETGLDERSHFRRFLGIYQEMSALSAEDLERVTRPVAENPKTSQNLNQVTVVQTMFMGAARAGERQEPVSHVITHPEALQWGHLFNLRYRMLLIDVSHAFRLAGPLNDGNSLTARGSLIHRTFAEMYNLRAVAGMLLQLPLDAQRPDGPRAGPPFEMPYSLELPEEDSDCWLLQRDLIQAAQLLNRSLWDIVPPERRRYLESLEQSDRLALEQLQRIIARR